MSSDILSRPLDFSKFGLIYAGAQKNIGPAGVTLVVIRKDLAERGSDKIPTIFRYKTHAAENSLYNTPPCFAIYLVMLVTRWIDRQGGLSALARSTPTRRRRCTPRLMPRAATTAARP
jgi:phosphoserine aminotransferase